MACLVLLTCAGADEITRSFSPDIGEWETLGGSYLIVEGTDDGHKVEGFQSSDDSGYDPVSPFPWFKLNFGSDGWMELTVDRFERTSASSWIFNPASSPGGAGLREGYTFKLRPKEYVLWLGTDECDGFRLETCADKTYHFEYSLVPIETPLPGDFNFDDEVGFADFLILSKHFERGLPRLLLRFW